jgi:hypothetical protein
VGRCEEGPVARSSLGQVAGRLLIRLHQDLWTWQVAC